MRRLYQAFALVFLSSNLHGKDISLAFTFSMPPYLNKDHKGGVELEIVRESLKIENIKVKRLFNVHFKRAAQMLGTKQVDAVADNRATSFYSQKGIPIYDSKETLHYVDCSITLKERNIPLKTPKDYAYLSISAFKTASQVLGENLGQVFASNPNYTEQIDQERQLELLVKKRIDVVITDRNIFFHKMVHHKQKYDPMLFSFTHLNTTPRSLKFHNKELRDSFDKGLIKIKSNGTYKKILSKYRSVYRNKCS